MSQREPYSVTRCVHYVSSVAVCRAGVDPVSLTDDAGRLPCVIIRGITGTKTCDKREIATPAASPAPGRMAQQLEAMLSGRCPRCGVLIVAEMEFNGSIVARPCQHVIRSAL